MDMQFEWVSRNLRKIPHLFKYHNTTTYGHTVTLSWILTHHLKVFSNTEQRGVDDAQESLWKMPCVKTAGWYKMCTNTTSHLKTAKSAQCIDTLDIPLHIL